MISVLNIDVMNDCSTVRIVKVFPRIRASVAISDPECFDISLEQQMCNDDTEATLARVEVHAKVSLQQ